jgi:UDP-N-acetylbacillosamine N-acetyltransferase
MKELIIFGCSGHAMVVVDTAIVLNINVSGYFAPTASNMNMFNLTYLGDDNAFDRLNYVEDIGFFVAIGNNQIRKMIIDRIKFKSHLLVNLIHPKSIVSAHTLLSECVFIGPGAVLNPGVKIGSGAIINSGAIIEHECEIGDYSHIAPGAVLAGNVHVGAHSFIGANAVVKEGITIGDNVIVGAGSVVISNLESNQTQVGNPSRHLK